MEPFKEQLQKQALEATLKTLQDKVSMIVCPVHGQTPRLKMSEDAGPGRQNLGFDCCCDTLAKLLQKTLKN